MRRSQNIFLVGPMGVGKSTIGRFLADDLKLEFYDTDREIEARCGADISWIFDVEGEEGFRKREASMIAELTQLPGIVLATGGGALIKPENRTFLAARGVVVYLKASMEQLLVRTAKTRTRPLLQTENPQETMVELLKEREAHYEEIADMTFYTDKRSVKAVANEIIEAIREIKL